MQKGHKIVYHICIYEQNGVHASFIIWALKVGAVQIVSAEFTLVFSLWMISPKPPAGNKIGWIVIPLPPVTSATQVSHPDS